MSGQVMKTQAMLEELELSIDPAALDFKTDSANEPEVRPAPRNAPSQAPSRKPLSLSLLLRVLGGLVIVAAFVMYLFQGWRDGDELTRCLLLLGHTAILTLAGLASGTLLHEAKGARLFIALALAAVPVNFAFLGGLTYGHLTWDAPQGMDAASSFWTAGLGGSLSAGSALLVTGASLAGLGLAVWLGFLVMARRSVWPLTALYLIANAALLVPTREDAAVSAILLGIGALIGALALPLRRRDPSLATPEGVFARGLLLLPLTVLGGRSLWLYAPDVLFFTTLSLIGYLGLRLAVAAGTDWRWRGGLEVLTLLFAGLSTVLAFNWLIDVRAVPDLLKLPLTAGVLAALLVDLSTLGGQWQGRYRGGAALTLALAMLLNLAAFGGFGNALAGLLVGIATLGYGYTAKARFIFWTGLVTALVGLGFAAQDALSSFTIGGWSALVLLGIITIVTGSVVERHGARMKAILIRWHRHFEREG